MEGTRVPGDRVTIRYRYGWGLRRVAGGQQWELVW